MNITVKKSLKFYKSSRALTEMTKLDELPNLYKCMIRECNFSTNIETLFKIHCQEHEDTLNIMYELEQLPSRDDAYQFRNCPYCNLSFNPSESLCLHIKYSHSYCKFLCGYCFYRGICKSHVVNHQKREHPRRKKLILESDSEVPLPPVTISRLNNKIEHYWCGVPGCYKRFYVTSAFLWHLINKHKSPKSDTIFDCPLCEFKTGSPQNFLLHYEQQHNMHQFHCIYCNFGARTSEKLHDHLSQRHYTEHGRYVERRAPERFDDRIALLDQLPIRIFDDSTASTDTTDSSDYTDSSDFTYCTQFADDTDSSSSTDSTKSIDFTRSTDFTYCTQFADDTDSSSSTELRSTNVRYQCDACRSRTCICCGNTM